LYHDERKRLELVKAIVTAKIHNQQLILYRHKLEDTSLKSCKKRVNEQATLNQVRGVEGLAAKEYFACWDTLLRDPWFFPRRNRRPSTD
jgi:CRISPR-associated protein Cas1